MSGKSRFSCWTSNFLPLLAQWTREHASHLVNLHVNLHIHLDKEVKDPGKPKMKAAYHKGQAGIQFFFVLSREEFIVTVHDNLLFFFLFSAFVVFLFKKIVLASDFASICFVISLIARSWQSKSNDCNSLLWWSL